MKPVIQKNLYFGGGDCFAACIASILEKPLEEVPNFNSKNGIKPEEFWQNVRSFLEPRNLKLKFADITDLDKDGIHLPDEKYVILCGPPNSVKNEENIGKLYHCWVAKKEDEKINIVHDPAGPQGSGIYRDFSKFYVVEIEDKNG